MGPLRQVTQVAQQQVNQQGHPHLPAHRVGIVPQEIAQLQRLLDLLEEDLDLSSTPVEVGHTARTPLQTVGRKTISRSLPSISTSATIRHINSGADLFGLLSTMRSSRR